MLGNACPSHYSPIRFSLSCFWELLGSSLHVFVVVSSFHSWENMFLVFFNEWEEDIHVLGVFRGHVCLPHAIGVDVLSPFTFSAVGSIFFHGWEVVFVLSCACAARIHGLGVSRGRIVSLT